ncbi:unnamed protein product [Lampetra planeri]
MGQGRSPHVGDGARRVVRNDEEAPGVPYGVRRDPARNIDERGYSLPPRCWTRADGGGAAGQLSASAHGALRTVAVW